MTAKKTTPVDRLRTFVYLDLVGWQGFVRLSNWSQVRLLAQHVIFYTKKLEKAQQWLIDRGIATEAVTVDSGGNRFFRFFDLDNNAIEVCVEP